MFVGLFVSVLLDNICVSFFIEGDIIICFIEIGWFNLWCNFVVSVIVSNECLFSVKKLLFVFSVGIFRMCVNKVVKWFFRFGLGVCFGIWMKVFGFGKVLWFSLLLVFNGNWFRIIMFIGIMCVGRVFVSCLCNCCGEVVFLFLCNVM